MSGWVKIHRDFFDRWEWASDPNTVAVWIRLLVDARYEPGAYRGTPLEAGQVIVGRKALAEKTGLTEQQVRTALNHLKESGIITMESTNKFSVVTVENWAVEQGLGDNVNQQNGQETTTQQPATNQQSTSNQPHTKKGNRETGKQGSKYNIGAPSAPPAEPKRKAFTPPTVEEVRAYCAERKNTVNPDSFVAFYESKGWMVGKNRMKDWRAAVRTWEQSEEARKEQMNGTHRKPAKESPFRNVGTWL